MRAYVIGAGGGGSWLVPSLAMLIGHERVTVVDGDKLEAKNLNRQLFTEQDIGRNKAEALAAKYGVQPIPEWYSIALIDHMPDDWIFGCVDNMPGRKAILDACDMNYCQCIIAGNETNSAEAYYYWHQWRECPTDPRVYYPEISSDYRNDPSRPASCTGEAQTAKPQLVSANLMAVSLAQWLFVFWALTRPELDRDSDESNFPYLLRSNMTRLETFLIRDAKKKD